ncbi:hypothetical protein LCGC14_0667520 [marine sediment metagenome]|uniref:Sialidase domain-containing protein n=1 Tax=marine sediment metagenome TaxID=412755 RepID=A0A0F9U020_9ZZZZ|nr:exo-alpha-sialidase [Candidatus Aminicenantes bacterium]HEB36063.1 exo-alpha-sialidase [Candidatus Aminicenantes bacterium]
MSIRRLSFILLVAFAFLIATGIPIKSNPGPDDEIVVGRNVNLAPYPTIGSDGLPVVNSGDPYLQRQNEPSMAVSTRNPIHLLAATNDYRTVYLPHSEGRLPGIELSAQAGGDAWLGIFKSYNGGQSWTTHLLPGYPQDDTGIGEASPLHVYEAACDPTVRAGSSGLFFVSGIGFDRIEHGGSGIFVARYIDNNTQAIGEMDSIEYIDVNMIDEGTSGQFADKPWIAVAAPTDEYDTVTIDAPSYTQTIPRFDVYMVYSIFLGSSTAGDHSQIWFAKSTDCGNTWGDPIKLSESVHVCQGTNIVVSPKDGTIYVAWRQYAREEQGVPDAIMMCKSEDSDRIFAKSTMVAEINAYDQFTYSAGPEHPELYRFRTSAFPAIAVDHNGLVYMAWSERVGDSEEGPGRIVIKTSNDGINWDGPTTAIDDHDGGGHQIMPSLAYAGGKLLATWYDTRNSPWNGLPDISGEPQTMDVRAAQADPSANPVFGDSVQVSRYLYYAKTNEAGDLVGANDQLVSETNPPVIYQANPDHPNRPIFDGGSSPFMGDYIDSAPSPMFLRDYETGTWRFNTGEGPFDPTLCHIVFASNRDVVPPTGGLTWASYQAPGTPGCLDDLTTGMRDQNVYTAPVTQGIQVYCPVNTKPLSIERRSFLVFVRNLTDNEKLIRLTIDAPLGMDVSNASFWEFGPPAEPDEECPPPFSSCTDRIVELPVLAHSSITLTVFVQPYSTDPLATLRVKVEETATGLKSSIILNPDRVNTGLINSAEVLEYDAPFVITEDLSSWDFDDVTMFSEEFVFTPEVLAELLEFSNPDFLAPTRRHPTRRHDAILNPTRRHSAVGISHDGQVTDISWSVENTGTATAAYSFDLIGETPSVPYQLLIYRVSSTLIPECVLSAEEHHELLLSFEDPTPLSPTRRHESLSNPTRRHNTFFLAPGETAICTLRLIDPNLESESGGSTQEAAIMSNGGTQEDFDPEFYAETVTGAFIPQAANENGEIEVAAFMWIYTTTLPDGSVNNRYNATQLKAEPETESYSWSLVPDYGDLPPGLKLTSAGVIQTEKNPIKGKIRYDPPYNEYDEENAVYYKTYNFAVRAEDSTGQTANRSLSIKVICPKCKRPKK